MRRFSCLVSSKSHRVPFSLRPGIRVSCLFAAFFPFLCLFGISCSVSAQSATTTTLTVKNASGSSVSSISSGTVAVLTASVTSGGSEVKLGTVKFCDTASPHCEDGYLAGSAQLTSNGTAILKFKPVPGVHDYQAFFHGTPTYASSVSSVENLTVTAGPFATTTALAQSGSAGNYTLTATMTSAGEPPLSPSGPIDFLDTTNSNYVLGSAPLSSITSTSTYAPFVGYSPGGNIGVIVADFNQDGIPDLLVWGEGSYVYGGNNFMGILLGKGDGTFQSVTGYNFNSNAYYPSAIAVGDLNGDGYPDVVVADGETNQLYVLLNSGNGQLGWQFTYSFPTFSYNGSVQLPVGPVTGIAIGDVNGDGKPDVAITLAQYGDPTLPSSNYENESTFGVMLGNGNGSLQTTSSAPWVTSYPSGIYAEAAAYTEPIELVDTRANGKLDVVVTDDNHSGACVSLNNGDGTFASPQCYDAPAGQSVAVGDLNGDGFPDLVVSSWYSANGSSAILLGKGDGTFSNATSNLAGGVSSVALADLNGDGKLDVVLGSNGAEPGEAPGTFSVSYGNGDGTFGTAINFNATAIGDSVADVAVGDLNGDGVPDILAVDGPVTVNVMLGSLSMTATATLAGVSPVGSNSTTHAVEASYAGDSYYSSSTSATTSLTPQPVPTTLGLTSSASTVTVGAQITLTATVTPGSVQGHTPSGDVTFYLNGNSIGTATPTNGVAVLKPHLVVVQSDSFTATYPGDDNFVSSNSNSTVNVMVQKAATTLTLGVCNYSTTWTCPATTSSYGQVMELSVTLSPYSLTGAGSTDGETVTFYNNGAVIGTGTLSYGGATLDLSQPAAGSYSFTASYGGDADFVASSTTSSSPMTVAKVTPSLSLGVSPVSTDTYGQPVYLTATFNTYPYNVSGETVTFYNGANVVGTSTFGNDSYPAMLTLNNLPVGNYNFTAKYSGDGNYLSTTATSSALTMQKLPTTLTVSAPSSIIFTYGTPVTVQVFLQPYNVQGANTTNGELITLYQNGTSVGTAAVSNGVAMFTITAPPVGNNAYTASYAGDTSFGPSTAAAGYVSVQQAPTTMGITTNALHGIGATGQPITLTATISSTIATGSVIFYQNGSDIGNGTVSNGVATYVVNGLPEGNYAFAASYSGDSNFGPSNTSSQANVTVLQATTLTLTTSPAHYAAPNQPVTITVTLSPSSIPGDNTNGQTVYIYNGTSQFGNATLTNGVGTYTPTNGLPKGTYSFTAVYDSDGILANATTATPVPFAVVTGELFVVNTNADDSGNAAYCTPQGSTTINSTDSACSLRDALLAAAAAPEGASISFATSAFPSATTITLTNGGLTLPANTTLTGPALNSGGANVTNLVTVDGGGNSNQSSSTVFTVTGTGTAINTLTISGGWTPWNNGNPPSGGGILNSGSLTLNDSTVTNNGTIASGGGIYNTGTLTVVGSTIAGNAASVNGPGNGGGIDNESNGTLTVINSTIANNTTRNGRGSGVAVGSGTATFTNSTISANAGGLYNGIYIAAGTVKLGNTIVSGNDGIEDMGGSYTDLGGNIIGYVNGSAINGGNLNLGPLDNYGGPTQTMLPLPGSSAICTGSYTQSPSQWSEPLTAINIDQRGYPNYNLVYGQLPRTPPASTPLPSACFDSGAVQTNYTAVQFAQTSYTGLAGGAVTPIIAASVTENGVSRQAVPVTLSYTGGGNLSSNSATTATGTGAVFTGLSADTAGSGTLSTQIIVAGTSYISGSTNLTVLGAPQISPGSESILTATLTPYSQSFSVSGGSGSYFLSSTGSVPPGLTLTPSGTATGSGWTLAGSPASSGQSTFTLTATDVTNSLVTVTQSYTITTLPGSTTTLTASPASSAPVGQTVTLTATVSSTSASGTVLFFDSGNFLGFGPATLSGGSPNTATLNLDPSSIGYLLPFGAHSFTAQFQGDGTHAGGTSNTVPYNVTAPNLVVNTTGDDDGSVTCTSLASTTSNTTDGNNGGTPGTCTLRDALNTASGLGAGTIYFDTTVFAASNLASNPAANTIAVNVPSYGTLNLQSNTTIQGPTSGSGATLTNLVTVDGGGSSVSGNGTIFYVPGSGTAINNLNINNGYASNGGSGGAITNAGSITVSGSAFTGNQATGSGGGIFNTFGSSLTVANSTFSSNSATGGNGGGIDSGCGNTTVSNSTFYQNSAANGGNGQGGAVNVDNNGPCTLTVNSSTIVGNSTDNSNPFDGYGGGGGGIYSVQALLYLTNNIIAGNTINGAGEDDLDDNFLVTNYTTGNSYTTQNNMINGNLVGIWNGLTENGTTVTLAPLANYGGPTQTMIPLPGSVAICAGIVGGTSDQRGNPLQPVGGYCPSGTVDSGSVQTNYALAFTTEPPASVLTGVALTPAPALTLTESGTVFVPATSIVSMTDFDGALSSSGTNSSALAAGTAAFSNLIFSSTAAGDTLTASLSLNPNLSPALYLVVSPPSTPVNVENATPTIITVSPILPQQAQTITISGSGFGSQAAYTGDSSYIQFVDNSGAPWAAGYNGNGVTLGVSSWTDARIVLSGFSGSYGPNHCIRPGDQLSISVWNPQTGEGPSIYPVVAASGTDNCPTKITSVSPIISQQTQTITISGAGFGSQAAYTGDSSYIQLEDTTGTPWFAGHNGNGVMVAVSSWTDTQIVLSGFSGSYGTNHCIRPGDHLSVTVWNTQTGIGPAVYPIVASGGTDSCPTEITSVSQVVSQQTQTITINGAGFGIQTAYTGDSEYIELADSTGNPWFAGHTGNGVTLGVSSWTDSQIVLAGFSGSYGTNHCIRPGDHLSVSIWNAQTGNGPATYSVVAGGGTDNCPTEITSVSPILPQQTQTITITGQGFGTQSPYTGDSNYIELVDSTGTWFAGQPGNMVGLAISSWNDTQIVITGLPGAYGTNNWCISPGDQLYVKVWNAQTAVGPATYPIVAISGSNTCL